MAALAKFAFLIVACAAGVALELYLVTSWSFALIFFSVATFVNVKSTGVKSSSHFLIGLIFPAFLIFAVSAAFVWFAIADPIVLWRAVHFTISILWVRGVLAFIKFGDIIRLPLSTDWRRDLLTLRALLGSGESVLIRLLWYTRRYAGPNSTISDLNKGRLAALLACVVWLFGHGGWISILIENRMRFFQGRAE